MSKIVVFFYFITSLLICKKDNTFQGFDALGYWDFFLQHLTAYHSQIETGKTKQQTGTKCKHILNKTLIKNPESKKS